MTRIQLANQAAQATAAPAPKKEWPIDFPKVDVLVIGGQVYSVSPVKMPLNDLLAETKTFYENEYQARIRELEREGAQEAIDDWNIQINHIRRLTAQDNIVIPPDMQGKLIMTHRSHVCFVRQIRYKPTEITGSPSDFRSVSALPYIEQGASRYSYKAEPHYKKVFNAIKDLPADRRVIVTVNQTVVDEQATFIFAPNHNRMYTPMKRYYHTLSDHNRVCTGNHSAETFWNAPDFVEQMNRINLFSLACAEVNGISYKQLFTDNFVTNIITEEANQWRA